ncbi:MAG TPA: hypothetical protein VHG28_19545, partial [Longimicrobiaceae bacterium]|nr:hypothetical protein [Longimicrobiaceae bacterium]
MMQRTTVVGRRVFTGFHARPPPEIITPPPTSSQLVPPSRERKTPPPEVPANSEPRPLTVSERTSVLRSPTLA